MTDWKSWREWSDWLRAYAERRALAAPKSDDGLSSAVIPVATVRRPIPAQRLALRRKK